MPLDNLAEQVSKLPALPRLLHNLMYSLQDNATGLNKIAKMVASDQAMGARVVKMANSAAYKGVREIISIEDACSRLGTQILHSTIVATHLMNGFPALSEVDRENFWSHTFEVAVLARSIAPLVGLNANTAFTCGMLYDLGNLVILLLADEAEKTQIQALIEQGMDKAQAQKQVLKMDYSQVGVILGSKWQFPALFTRCMAQHLDPLNYEEICEEAALVALALQIKTALDLSDSLLKKRICAGGNRPLVAELLAKLPQELLQYFGLSIDILSAAVETTIKKQEQEQEALFH